MNLHDVVPRRLVVLPAILGLLSLVVGDETCSPYRLVPNEQ
jgi:hypothetical protein